MAKRGNRPQFSRQTLKVLGLHILGIGVLFFLLRQLNIEVIEDSFRKVSWGILLTYLAATPRLFFHASALHLLVDREVSYMKLIYNQLVGNSYNNLIPLGGLGGVPYKIHHLSQWLSIEKASQVVVNDRLIHILARTLEAVLTGSLMLALVSIPTELFFPITGILIALALFSLVAVFVIASNLPSRLTGFFLTRFRLLKEFKQISMGRRQFFLCLFLKLAARLSLFIEAGVIFILIGIPLTPEGIITVMAFLSFSSTLLFFVPQGIGVDEGGVVWAFSLLGYSPSLGLSVGLIRRARILSFTLFGIAMHLSSILMKRLR